ncbi:MAG: S41 family peptidase, partial [Planctomycetota bacterium]
WVSFSAETDAGREVFVQGFEKEVRPTGMDKEQRRAERPTTAENSQAVKQLRQAMDDKYSYRDLRGVDWNEMFKRYGPLMERAKTPREFAKVAARMLGRARDMHVWVKIDGETIGVFKRKVRLNYNMDVIKEAVPDWRDRNEFISTGHFRDDVGYIMIRSWKAETAEAVEPVFEALRDFANAPGLIIDVRPNGGGSETLAREVAGCFVNGPVLYAKHVNRSMDSPGGFGKVRERVLKPNKAGPKYRGRIAVLMGPANMSSCEVFLLMMKRVPNCTLIGARSYGSSGNPKPVELGNGVTVWLPSWKALRPDGTCFEGQGVKPDILVRTGRMRSRRRDRVLEAALKSLREPQRGRGRYP